MLIENRMVFAQTTRYGRRTTIARHRRKGRLLRKNGGTLTIELSTGMIITDKVKFWSKMIEG